MKDDFEPFQAFVFCPSSGVSN